MEASRIALSSRLAPAALTQEHEEIRAGLAKATVEGGPIGEAVRRVAELCVPHFELEEATVFPAFATVNHLLVEDTHCDTARIESLIAAFYERRVRLANHHQSILFAIETLWQVAYEEGNDDIAILARRLKNHERMDGEVLYRAVLLVGKCLEHAVNSNWSNRCQL